MRLTLLLIGLLLSACSSEQVQDDLYSVGELLYSDSFGGDLSSWSFEMESPSNSEVRIRDRQLEISTFEGGTTAWFLQKLTGSVMIEYTATAMPIGGVADSVSDVNAFWMLTDLQHPEDIQADSSGRAGRFPSYHKLPGYYVGKGAGRNTRTTFKKHDMLGNGTREDWGLLSDASFLLKPSYPHKIQLVYFERPDSSLVQFICDGVVYFEKWDMEPCRSGWFGFRGWNTRVRYDDFRVYRLEAKDLKSSR